ncbi:MAG: hypothetical protein QM626_05895 [Microbacterium sp.]|uniref:hypothetical protein n=1 Tax=Microbacterium sp. TaxID=51671 RepID=UPI0039E48F25
MRIWGAVLVAALIALPTAAYADDTNYTPVDPSRSTLAGSTVDVECEGTDLRLVYDVRVTQPEGSVAVSGDVRLTVTSTGTVLDLGSLTDGAAAGEVVWPLDDTPGTLAAQLEVVGSDVPTLTVSVHVAECDPRTADVLALAVTGLDAPVAAIVGAALAAVVLGAVVLVVRARRRRATRR